MLTHSHHIVPRHAGGTDNESNLFSLSVVQHALAHRNRAILECSPNDWIAWKALSGQWGKDEARRKAVGVALRGKPKSEEQKAKISKANMGRHKGRAPWNVGKKVTFTSDHKNNMRGAKSPQHAAKIANNNRIRNLEQNKTQVSCVPCGKTGSLPVMSRWHLENCNAVTA